MASSIRVVFEVDNRKYIADVKRAEDATKQFANTTDQGLKKIKPAADGLSSSFAKLSGIIAGIGISAFVSNVIRSADAFNNLSKSTDVSLESIIGLSNALVAAGGSSDKARDGISDLVKNIGEARNGSKELQMSFIQAGVTISDLEKLSNKDILRKTIKGLAEMTDRAKATSIGMKLMGESIKGADIRTVNNTLDQYIIRAGAQAEASISAANAQTNLAVAFSQLQEKVLIAIQPITDFIASLSPEQIEKMTQGVVDLSKALVAFSAAVTALKGIISIIGLLGGAFALAKTGVTALAGATAVFGGALASLNRTATFTAGYLDRFRRGTGMFRAENGAVSNLTTLLDRLIKRLPFAGSGLAGVGQAGVVAAGGLARMVPFAAALTGALFSLNEILKLFTDTGGVIQWGSVFANVMARATESVGLFAAGLLNLPTDALAGLLRLVGVKIDNPFGLGDGLKNVVNQARAAREEVERIALLDSLNKNRVAVAGPGVVVATGKPDTRAADALKLQADAVNKVKTDLEKFRQTQTEVVNNYQRANNEITKSISLEQSFIGLSTNEIALSRAKEEILKRQRDLVDGLVKEQNKLRLDLGTDPTAAAKIAAISNTIAEIGQETTSAQSRIEAFTRSLQAAESVERMRLGTIQQIIDLENLRATVLGFSLTEQEKFNQAQNDGVSFLNKTAEEIALLKQQAIERDKVTGSLTAERIARETNASLLELETSILGTQFTALQKLEQLKLANPDAFSRKTQDEIAALTAQAAKIDEVTAKFREQAFARDLLQQGQDFAQGIRDEMSMQLATGEAARRRIQVEIDGRNQLQAKIREINQSYGDERNLSESLRQQRAKEIADATAGIGKLQAAKAQAVAEDQAQRDSFNFGWESAFSKYAEDALNAANQSKTYFESFTKGFENAFVKFVQTGKISFKDLANSIIADFARIQAKKALVGLFGGGGGGGGGFLGNIVSSIFGGFFANGGNPPVGKMSIVGERGPEAFIPRNAGTIVPLSGMGGSNTTNVTYSIQAVDAASFQQLVASDPKFLHAVVEKGRRSLPQGGRR
jgi:lambda family phage tail tape measure protein